VNIVDPAAAQLNIQTCRFGMLNGILTDLLQLLVRSPKVSSALRECWVLLVVRNKIDNNVVCGQVFDIGIV
jgi:hypothetical protein